MNVFNRSAMRIKNGFPYFEIPEMAKIGWIQHGFLTRMGGVSLPPYHSLNLGSNRGDQGEHVSQNKNLIAKAFGFDPKRLILLRQMQKDQILLLKGPLNPIPSFLEYDAMITDSPNTFLGILTADCIPIFVVDQRRKVIAAVHAGRQGTAFCLTIKVLKKMEEEFGCSPNDLLIALGPSIKGCCYEIDNKVFLPEWEPFSTSTEKGKWRVDLVQINIALMKKEGIRAEQIFRFDLCTSCHHDLFFSHRKERGKTGRQLSFIGITG